MSVGELIDLLFEYDRDTPVFVGDGLGGADDIEEASSDYFFGSDGIFPAVIID